MLRSLGRLLDVPGVYVWGSNDYYAPTLKNPLRYLTERGKPPRPGQHKLPWEDLGRAFSDRGWVDLTHERAVLEVRGVRFGFRGTDDAHLGLDHYSSVAGPIDRVGARRRRRRDARALPQGARGDDRRRPRPDPRRPHPRRPGLRARPRVRW